MRRNNLCLSRNILLWGNLFYEARVVSAISIKADYTVTEIA
jgi:hypothetical protein